jgi:hypothetical protein
MDAARDTVLVAQVSTCAGLGWLVSGSKTGGKTKSKTGGKTKSKTETKSAQVETCATGASHVRRRGS